MGNQIKLAFRNFARPGLGVEDHQELVLGQLMPLEPNKTKPDGREISAEWAEAEVGRAATLDLTAHSSLSRSAYASTTSRYTPLSLLCAATQYIGYTRHGQQCPGEEGSLHGSTRECLSLNNFSAVHAIVSALCSDPIHRLHRTWAAVSSKSTKYLKQLCKTDTAVKRDLLIKAGSFKVATQERNHQRAQMRLRRQKVGVVPFLGDFLTVLQRLDSAIPDDLDGNINKKRKEVRVLQEMQLLQVAAMNYRLRPLEKFVTYFKRMEQLSDKERLHCSVAISAHCNVCLLASRPLSASQAAGTTTVHHHVLLFCCCCSATSFPASWSPNPSRPATSCSGWDPTGMLARTPALHHPSPRP
ncbi:PREDICTED: ral-GDS-related protein-like [Cercocebus atys]|uniref:ral-GDS-related protein-like n=1 Tax=Cercocebus atys TaxID=9531 RepID=UPI0005F4D169|nr:PREDICTED: ral-GDS-related protein-like [Cercocebus atys]